MVSSASAGDAAAPKAGNQPLSGSMNPGPVIESSNTKTGSDPTASSGYPIPKLADPTRGVEGTNKEIDHGADLTKETGKAFTQGKVDGEAQGEKHLDGSLDQQSAPSGAAKIKEVSFLCVLCKLLICMRVFACTQPDRPCACRWLCLFCTVAVRISSIWLSWFYVGRTFSRPTQMLPQTVHDMHSLSAQYLFL